MQADPAGIGGPYRAPDVLELWLRGGDNVESANADSKNWIKNVIDYKQAFEGV